MKTDIRFTAILVVAALSLAFCGAAEAAYKIVLTNGSVLIVDSYREDDGMITADWYGDAIAGSGNEPSGRTITCCGRLLWCW